MRVFRRSDGVPNGGVSSAARSLAIVRRVVEAPERALGQRTGPALAAAAAPHPELSAAAR